ncbi:exopolysaccharide production repressor protein [Mesorhizobium kowhaii]|nr:exopolysaccharide production repressor protein [Mesorhizobium kowhaii]
MIFGRLLALVLTATAVTVYFASQSIRLAVVTTLACLLLLQMVYFGSVVFLVWRSSCACRAEVRVSQRSWKPAAIRGRVEE